MNLPGRLRMTTLGDLLGTLHRAEATGTLELAEDIGRTHRVYLSAGFVVAVEIDGATPTLGEILRRDHALDDGLLKRSLLRAISSQRLHGDVLVQDFHVEGAVVGAALRRQIIARLERLDQLTDARVLFRVAVRAPRGALTSAPVPAAQFLAGKKRARDTAAGGAKSARAPGVRLFLPWRTSPRSGALTGASRAPSTRISTPRQATTSADRSPSASRPSPRPTARSSRERVERGQCPAVPVLQSAFDPDVYTTTFPSFCTASHAPPFPSVPELHSALGPPA